MRATCFTIVATGSFVAAAGAAAASCSNVVPAAGTPVNVWGCMILAKSHDWLPCVKGGKQVSATCPNER